MSGADKRGGRRGTGQSQRDRGLNPRALGTNPRALGTNPKALDAAGQVEPPTGYVTCRSCITGLDTDCRICEGLKGHSPCPRCEGRGVYLDDEADSAQRCPCRN